MKPAFKVIVGSAIVCVIGAIVIDMGILTTGYTLMFLGVAGICFGPVAQDL